jgi:DNA polymerase III subunit epsilon
MNILALVDSETTGLEPKDGAALIEVGVVLWSIEHRCIIDCVSRLVQHPTNEAEAVNRIPPAALALGGPREAVLKMVRAFAARADVLVAHRAEFDQKFFGDLGRPWACSKFDVPWPRSKPGDGLVHVALAHGVGVVTAHRALTDCLTLAALFERVAELGHDVREMIRLALRPKAVFQALVSNEERDKAKALGFTWKADTKQWLRALPPEDAAKLPFPTREMPHLAGVAA